MTAGIPFPDIDPIAFSYGWFSIRWYSLAYLMGFLGGWRYGVYLVGLKLNDKMRPNQDDIDNIVAWIVIGVIIGGRLGYVLFYNLDYYLYDPWSIPLIWEGGMSFHGGLIGVAMVIILYAWRLGFSILRLGDVISCVVPIGLCLGRLANFTNGELFGRVTTVSWGVIFPDGGPLPRHPSQFYEAFLEGIVLLVVLGILAHRPSIRNKPGTLFGVFLIGYSISRMIVELFREPDPQIGFIFEYLSLGQILSLPMLIVGGVLVYVSQKGLTK